MFVCLFLGLAFIKENISISMVEVAEGSLGLTLSLPDGEAEAADRKTVLLTHDTASFIKSLSCGWLLAQSQAASLHPHYCNGEQSHQNIFLSLCVCMCTCVCASLCRCTQCLWKPDEGARSPGAEFVRDLRWVLATKLQSSG